MSKDLPPTGSFGEVPENFPKEISQPLQPAMLQQMADAAAANERPLAPFLPQGGAPIVDPSEPDPGEGASTLPTMNQLRAEAAERKRIRDEQQVAQPAASDTDSPSRGIPKPIDDPGKTITGGFGLMVGTEYFPLDGSEVRECARGLMDKLNRDMQDDLRFHMAITYERVKVSVIVAVEGWASEQGVRIERVALPDQKRSAPEDVAAAIGDKIAFVLLQRRREFDEDGNAEHPPDYVRQELGLPVPRKQTVTMGNHRAIVDRVPGDPGEMF